MKKLLLLAYGFTGSSALNALIKKHDVISVVIPPESKTNKFYSDNKLINIEKISTKHKINVIKSNKIIDIKKLIEKYNPDAVIVSSYNKRLPADLLKLSKFINVHHGDLPRWRGRANINWAIINNRNEVGISIHEMTEEIDDGPIYAQYKIRITKNDNVKTIYDKVNIIIEKNLATVIENVINGLKGKKQIGQKTYCCTRLPEDGYINWDSNTVDIHNLIKGLTKPYDGAFTYFNNKKMIVWKSEIPTNPKIYEGSIPGRVVEIHNNYGIEVLTGDSSIILKNIQYKGLELISSELIRSVKTTLGLDTNKTFNFFIQEIEKFSEKIKLLENKIEKLEN